MAALKIQTPAFLCLAKKSRRLIGGKETAFGGRSGCAFPNVLKTGVVFAGGAEMIGRLYRTAGEEWITMISAKNVPAKTSYSLYTLAGAPWIPKNFPAFSVGRASLGPPLIGACMFGRMVSAPYTVPHRKCGTLGVIFATNPLTNRENVI